MTGNNTCAMCGSDEADHGMLCVVHRAEDAQIERTFSDDVDHNSRDERDA